MSELNNYIEDISKYDFSSLLEIKLRNQPKEGDIVMGIIRDIVKDRVIIDVGLKTEGIIPMSEFSSANKKLDIGDSVEVFIEKLEDKHGNTRLSFDRVAREKSWAKFEKACEVQENVVGKIIGKLMKGGYAVEIEGILAFLPGSHLDIRQVQNPHDLFNISQEFRVLKIDRSQGNIVVSRRSVIEDSRKEAKANVLSGIKEGVKFKGIVKNITNYGAFIDLGEIDGLLHMSDISWNRISHPTELLRLGQKVDVVVVKYNQELQRVSLGMKQLTDNPWKGIDEVFQVNKKYKGLVSEINEFGIFVDMKDNVNITGLVYPNEVFWNSKRSTFKNVFNLGQEVDVKILEVDITKHRLSLSIKRCMPNPWEQLLSKYPLGTRVTAKVVKIMDFGLLVSIASELDTINQLSLFIPATEIDWNYKPKESLLQFKVNDSLECMILNADIEKEKITLSIKRLEENDIKKITNRLIEKGIVTCKILAVTDVGLKVEIEEGVRGFIKRNDLSKDKTQQNPDRFAVGDRLDAKPISFDKLDRLLKLSVKQLEIDEERKAIHDYGAVNSGATLADILGAAIEDDSKS